MFGKIEYSLGAPVALGIDQSDS